MKLGFFYGFFLVFRGLLRRLAFRLKDVLKVVILP